MDEGESRNLSSAEVELVRGSVFLMVLLSASLVLNVALGWKVITLRRSGHQHTAPSVLMTRGPCFPWEGVLLLRGRR
jgi:hypothetical protein